MKIINIYSSAYARTFTVNFSSTNMKLLFTAMHQSKCKYMKGVTEHASKHIVNLRRLCRTLPGQSDLFVANTKRCAVPIEGSGGLIAILEVREFLERFQKLSSV